VGVVADQVSEEEVGAEAEDMLHHHRRIQNLMILLLPIRLD
jgi:hypothetical protein